MKKLLLVFSYIFCVVIYSVKAQVPASSFTFNAPTTGSYSATNYILLKPGFQTTTFSGAIITDPYTPLNLSNENYVLTRNFQKETTTGIVSRRKDVLENITYFDGLGRPKQSIAIQQSPTKEDIVTHIAYDELGRQNEEYLPYAVTSNNGGIITGAELGIKNYYKAQYTTDFPGVTDVNLINAYSKKEFDNSPLNRVLKQAAPGKAWELGSGHEIELDYLINTTADAVKLYKVTITKNGNLYVPNLEEATTNYLEGQLYKTITKDENHSGTSKNHTIEEFKNKQGEVVLKRTYNNNAPHDTYYVYDTYGNLTYVLPPKVSTADGSVSATELSELCYQYKYDHRNRLVEKKIPGKGWEYIVYDKLNRVIATQDAIQNTSINKYWSFIKYDKLGRIVYTGEMNNNQERPGTQTSTNTFFQHENRVALPNNYAGTSIYYTKKSFPSSFNKIYTINYYDTYVDLPSGFIAPTSIYGKPVTNNTQGLPTVSKIRVLDTDKWITKVTYYDTESKPIYVYSKNEYLQTTDVVENKLDFSGKVLETKTTHKKGNSEIITLDVFSYDHAGRMTKQTNKINNQTAETIVENEYDKLGHLKNKKIGAGLQKVDYSYNVRGWLKNINQDSDANDNDLFNFSLKYNNPTIGTALFNGNIAQTNWNSLSVNTGSTVSNQYTYSYDALNRITGAVDNTGHYNISGIAYDKNGNLETLNRNGYQGATNFTNMDKLKYTYSDNNTGNKLIKVEELIGGNKNVGFKDGANAGNDYSYDVNGNMVSDANKGITNIIYNHLNLPTRIDIGNSKIEYVYDAAGLKLEKKAYTTGNGAEITQYAGNYIYKVSPPSRPTGGKTTTPQAVLEFFSHPEGYIKPVIANGSTTISSFEYVYQYKDHLGNVRLSYTDANNDGVITASTEIIEESNYYPFGLKHKGYNNNVSSLGNSTAQKFGYLNQEFHENLELNWHSYKWRFADPTLGRFFGSDPITEEYYYQTNYQFASNNPIWKIEIEGLEGKKTTPWGTDLQDDFKSQEELQNIAVIRKAKSLWNSLKAIGEAMNNPNLVPMMVYNSLAPIAPYAKAYSNSKWKGVAEQALSDYRYNIQSIAIQEGISLSEANTVFASGIMLDVAIGIVTDGAAASFKFNSIPISIYNKKPRSIRNINFDNLVKTPDINYSDGIGSRIWAYVDKSAIGFFENKLDGSVTIELNIPGNLQGKGIGSSVFSEAVDGVDNFTAVWVRSDIYKSGISDNLVQYQTGISNGLSSSKAAWGTWTGYQASNNGFTKALVKEIKNGITVDFSK
ncbi:RHS repeat-associated core domain-containing protein [Tenacibaculum sp. MAR_2010_89]|uniref:DUF6443 domain-containing protein n=1 Tax=Tenacibaculum sp. MAR_2010_89 TaxID=1250198 RepID=UPI0008986E4E|nr:DUF6443 domain-containing protein [Tenacibaculum sp. MAR_2010_89]SEE29519.1 RHS repeat-associated core domain-containing protein [Tenacibaculum sp. MAR_2010_89]